MAWIYLALAISCEVTGTLSLRKAATDHPGWFIVVGAGYVAAFLSLSGALSEGMGLGFAYGIWAVCGVALIAILSRVLFNEPLTPLATGGVVLVIVGVVVVNLGVPSGPDDEGQRESRRGEARMDEMGRSNRGATGPATTPARAATGDLARAPSTEPLPGPGAHGCCRIERFGR